MTLGELWDDIRKLVEEDIKMLKGEIDYKDYEIEFYSRSIHWDENEGDTASTAKMVRYIPELRIRKK